jgi:hypothetical protein
VGIPPQSRAGVCPETRALLSVQSDADSIALSSARFLLNSFLISHPGRAPPFEVPHS